MSLRTVNFGSGNAGIATVGYTIYREDGQVDRSRTTDGVFEIGTNTGVFGANISLNSDTDQIILWDTGTTPLEYGIDESSMQLSQIQEETDSIHIIWNTLVNNGELYIKLIEKIDSFKAPKGKEYTKELAEISELLKELSSKEYPKLEEIKRVLNINIPEQPAPIVNIPEVKIPDYSSKIKDIEDSLKTLSSLVKKIPIEQKDYAPTINDVKYSLSELLDKIDGAIKLLSLDNSARLIAQSNELKREFNIKTSSKADKDDIHKMIMQIEHVMNTFNAAQSIITGLIKSVDGNFQNKVKAGYSDAVNEKRNALKAKRQAAYNENLRIGLGIKHG